LFLSNGPGNPVICAETLAELEKVAWPPEQVKPIYGNFMGNQLKERWRTLFTNVMMAVKKVLHMIVVTVVLFLLLVLVQ
jgi:hypothetical protein